MKRVRPPHAPVPPLPGMTDAQWLCWFAGIMDGEGSFGVSTRMNCIRVSVGNTDKRMLDMVVDRAGCGRVWFERRSTNPKRINNGDFWVWRVRNMVEAEVIIRRVYPFLVVKKEAADECLAYIEQRLHVPARAIRERNQKIIAMRAAAAVTGGI